MRNRHPICFRLTPCPLTPDLCRRNSESIIIQVASKKAVSHSAHTSPSPLQHLLMNSFSVVLSVWAELISARVYNEIFIPALLPGNRVSTQALIIIQQAGTELVIVNTEAQSKRLLYSWICMGSLIFSVAAWCHTKVRCAEYMHLLNDAINRCRHFKCKY